ncbi:hypothetical protein EJ02DRAFT_471059 [Clathrospora elynae]|uniref:Uncharacterized protein n=1 Tax=Clathrospora elynae TaxID=706981 RepID=A0A6A5S866_9PLEO|nr:hypothetical protein EJ02DRAFT_471059 [Clathrospora elynae]
MTSLPWITFETSPSGNTVTYHEPGLKPSLSEAHARAVESSWRPSFVTLVGRRSKTILLDRLLGGNLAIPVHKEVYLWSLPQQSGGAPLVVIDCGMQNSQSPSPNPTAARRATPATSWSLPKIRNVNATLCGRVFSPFSSVICCFVSDLGGPRAVAKWLADLANVAAPDLPTVPRILLVVETTSDTFDERIAANKATAQLHQALQINDCIPENLPSRRNIGEIEVLGLQSSKLTQARARALKRRLLAMSEVSMKERASDYTQFSYAHFQALTKQALSHISSNITTPFHFAGASRPRGFTTDLLEACLSDFLQQMPSQAWLWHFAAPLIASALLLASYPPNAHNFAPDYLFNALYSAPCRAAIATYTMHKEIQRKFVSAVLHEFRIIFKTRNSNTLSTSELHRQTLSANHHHLADLKSHRTCFCCFLRMPEKVLACGGLGSWHHCLCGQHLGGQG